MATNDCTQLRVCLTHRIICVPLLEVEKFAKNVLLIVQTNPRILLMCIRYCIASITPPSWVNLMVRILFLRFGMLCNC